MAKTEEQIVIVLIKNYWEGFFQSLAWLIALSAGIGVAVWLESAAMQWAMAIFWFISVIAWAISASKKRRFTPEDAIAEIQQYVKTED